MTMKTAIVVVGAGAIMTLHGCGGSGGSGSSTSSQAPSTSGADTGSTSSWALETTVMTSTLPPASTAPLSGADAAAMMNTDYHGFNKDDPSGSIGTYIRVTDSTDVFCHTGCYNGWADCRVSGSVYNPTQIITTTGTLSWSFGDVDNSKNTGFVVNQTLIKARLAKCAYTVDGGTDFKYNMGCGTSTASAYGGHCTTTGQEACDSEYCAYKDLDPATDYHRTVRGDSAVVKDGAMGGGSPCTDAATCAYKGPSFYKETGYIADDTFEMLKWRANNMRTANYNELIIDGELMIQELNFNPAGTIPAIVYTSTGGNSARQAAVQMALAMQTTWGMSAPVPVIKIDLDVVVTDGGDPFVFEDAHEMTV